MVKASEMRHVDDFIDDPKTDAYASWVLDHFRRSAMNRIKFDKFMKDHLLFCTYNGARYRVTGASRLGDIWLTKDFKEDTTYTDRVDIRKCSNWGPKP